MNRPHAGPGGKFACKPLLINGLYARWRAARIPGAGPGIDQIQASPAVRHGAISLRVWSLHATIRDPK